MSRAVVITGVGAVTPLGVGARTLHRALDARASSASPTARAAAREFEPDRLPLDEGGAPRRPLHAVRARRRRRGARPRPAGATSCRTTRDRIGCVIGTGIGGIGTLERSKDVLIESGAEAVSPLSVPLMMGNAAAAAVSHAPRAARPVLRRRLRLRGAAPTRSAPRTADPSPATPTPSSPAAPRRRSRRSPAPPSARSTRLSPTGISRPFDARPRRLRDGRGRRRPGARGRREGGASAAPTVLGDAARLRRDRRRLPPDRAATRRAAARRGRSRRRSPTPASSADDVDYVNAHGTSTPLNDARRDRGAQDGARRARATRSRSPRPKSSIGHLLGAAGAVEAIATIARPARPDRPADARLEEPERGARPRLRPRRGPSRWTRRRARRSRSPTRSASAATTPCSCLEAGVTARS